MKIYFSKFLLYLSYILFFIKEPDRTNIVVAVRFFFILTNSKSNTYYKSTKKNSLIAILLSVGIY